MDDATLTKLRTRLEEERASVERRIADEAGGMGGREEGFADSAHVTAERSEKLAFVEQLQTHKEEIDAAFRRIEEGTYGNCERCGQPISPERLEAIPATRLCVNCASA